MGVGVRHADNGDVIITPGQQWKCTDPLEVGIELERERERERGGEGRRKRKRERERERGRRAKWSERA